MLKSVALATALVVIAGPVRAGTPVLDQREQHQAQRIHEGWHSGELTHRELARLVRGQAQLRRMEARAKADGIVTGGERARLGHRADVESRRIFRRKHDARRRGG